MDTKKMVDKEWSNYTEHEKFLINLGKFLAEQEADKERIAWFKKELVLIKNRAKVVGELE